MQLLYFLNNNKLNKYHNVSGCSSQQLTICCRHCEVPFPSEQHNVFIIMMEWVDATITCIYVYILCISSRCIRCKFTPSSVQLCFLLATFNPEDLWGAVGFFWLIFLCFPVWFDGELIQGTTFYVGSYTLWQWQCCGCHGNKGSAIQVMVLKCT